MEFGQQKSQFRISMQTSVENPLMTIESFNRQFQIGEGKGSGQVGMGEGSGKFHVQCRHHLYPSGSV